MLNLNLIFQCLTNYFLVNRGTYNIYNNIFIWVLLSINILIPTHGSDCKIEHKSMNYTLIPLDTVRRTKY